MKTTSEMLNKIYDKTCGKCHLCHKKLAFKNYASHGNKGSWEIEHSKPKSKGGTDHINNLYPACISCNREKSNGSNYVTRSKNGKTKAPFSEKKKQAMRKKTSMKYGVTGFIATALLTTNPLILTAVTLTGAAIGKSRNIDE